VSSKEDAHFPLAQEPNADGDSGVLDG